MQLGQSTRNPKIWILKSAPPLQQHQLADWSQTSSLDGDKHGRHGRNIRKHYQHDSDTCSHVRIMKLHAHAYEETRRSIKQKSKVSNVHVIKSHVKYHRYESVSFIWVSVMSHRLRSHDHVTSDQKLWPKLEVRIRFTE